MRLFGRELHGISKALVVLVAILLVTSGLCGITTSIESYNHWGWFGPGLPDTPIGLTLTIVDLIAYLAFMISGLLTIVLLVIWPSLRLMEWLYGRSDARTADKNQSIYDLASRGQIDGDDFATKPGSNEAHNEKPRGEDQP